MWGLDKHPGQRVGFMRVLIALETAEVAYLLLARVENFARFDGEALAEGPVMGHAQEGGVPHEMHNFSVATDGYIYGYLPNNGGGRLDRLGGDQDAKAFFI